MPLKFLVFLSLCALSPLAISDYVSPIISSPGLYFDKLLDVKFTNNDWKVLAYLDISHVQPNLDKVEFLLEKLSVFCNSLTSSKIQSDCINSLTALKNQHLINVNKFSSVSYLLQNDNAKQRFKRGLIDLGGSILKTIFGTLDAEDAVKYSEAINSVQTDEKHLAHLMKDNIHVIQSTISSFNNSISKVNLNEKHLLENMETIHTILDSVSNTNDKLTLKTQINSLSNSLEAIILTSSFDIDDINNAILFAKLNILHPTVLSPYQLYNELDKHRNKLPSHYDLPIPLTLQNIQELTDISKLVCYYHQNKIIFVLHIPLVLPQTYNLYNIIPLPVPYDILKPDTYILIEPTSSYVAVTGDRMFYSLLRDIDKCKLISEKCFVCVLADLFSVVANPTCETTLLTEVVTKLPDSCVAKIVHGSIDVFHKLSFNRWIFVQSEPGKSHITCEKSDVNLDVILFGTGILTLPKHCKAFYKTLQFTAVDETSLGNVTNVISNFNILLDDCCEQTKINKTFSKLPHSNLKNIGNLDSLLHASIHLRSMEDELYNLENPSHFDTYGNYYMSLSLFSSILFIFYLLYKCRKNITSQKNPCCIQIFNQCHNSKTRTDHPTSLVVFKDNNSVKNDSMLEETNFVSTPTPLKRNVVITNVVKDHEM
ncbi:uncharacterized protein LOC121732689 [Aricia agestis]|uniref:uncharacterized protein LOC121732689 n=1 Tax=Aricia agestis TaxID=91739 RepID=UPI001C20267E|nr:uncharacterized protein LOC121732689 [Aricia agestis]